MSVHFSTLIKILIAIIKKTFVIKRKIYIQLLSKIIMYMSLLYLGYIHHIRILFIEID